MIPKIIHYCWLSGDSIPQDMQDWMKSWQKLKGYEFVLWDLKRFDINKSKWVKDAFELKKYAFAADYIRAYALYNYGGIYMDMDVEVVKPFDDLLDQDYLLADENPLGLEAGIMGAKKGFPLFKDVLDYYDSHGLLDEDGNLTSPPPYMPGVVKVVMEAKYAVSRDYMRKPAKFDNIYIRGRSLRRAIIPIATSWSSPKRTLYTTSLVRGRRRKLRLSPC